MAMACRLATSTYHRSVLPLTFTLSDVDFLNPSPITSLTQSLTYIVYRVASICAITAYSFTVSCLLLLIMKYIPGLHLRVSEEVEINGLDGDHFFEEQIGEWAEFERRTYHGFPLLLMGHP